MSGTSDHNVESEDSLHRSRMQALQKEQREKVKSKTEKRGVLIVNTGDGKGKSTSAFGLALRAVGNGLKVSLIQFIKGKWKTGEMAMIARFPEIEHIVAGDGFTWDTQDRAQDIASARRGWEAAKDIIEASRIDTSRCHLLILDELNIALRYDYLPIEEITETLARRPPHIHVAVTGRDAKPELIAIADTVTEMKLVKHAFDRGVKAQKGIEF